MDCSDRVRRDRWLRGAVLAGDESAWRTWYEETFDDLYRYARWRSGGRRDWADEVVQETWLTAVRRIRQFDAQQGSFSAWLRGIAANVVRNHLRKWRRISKSQQPANSHVEQTSPSESPEENGRAEQRIAAALASLPEREESVLRAKYLEGLSVAEIASARAETPKAIESLLSRARQAFRKAYGVQGDNDADAG